MCKVNSSRVATASQDHDLKTMGSGPSLGFNWSKETKKAQRAEEPGQFAEPEATAACSGPEPSTPFWKGGGWVKDEEGEKEKVFPLWIYALENLQELSNQCSRTGVRDHLYAGAQDTPSHSAVPLHAQLYWPYV